MKLNLELNEKSYRIDTKDSFDLSIPIADKGQINAYYLNEARFKPFQSGSFIGEVVQGGSVNCFDVYFNPHGNGTHTESIGHIDKNRTSVNQVLNEWIFIAQVLTVKPDEKPNGDNVIGIDHLKDRIDERANALIIRTLPNEEAKRNQQYSGTNPTFFHPDAASYIRSQSIDHLLVDLPSLDREEDDGKLASHREFWDFEKNARRHATITELIFVPESVDDDIYLLNLQVAAIELDASPSRPVIYKLYSSNE